MRVLAVVLAVLFPGTVACSSPANSGDAGAPAAPQASIAKPHANLAELMRGIPFPASNLIFDTQTRDPGAPPPKADKTVPGAGATVTYASVYPGWELVEYSALALAETANLIMIPGRVCSNGKPVPVQRDDFKRYAQGLVDAGMAAYKAAQARNLDAMIEVTGTVSDACAACHEVYRDRGEAGSPERCAVPGP